MNKSELYLHRIATEIRGNTQFLHSWRKYDRAKNTGIFT